MRITFRSDTAIRLQPEHYTKTIFMIVAVYTDTFIMIAAWYTVAKYL